GVAVHAGFDVTVGEPDVATLQLQGPKSAALLQGLIGDGVSDLAYYRLMEAEIRDIPVVVSRTGWSGERGYEIYLLDTHRGPELWDTLMEAGRAYGIAPAAPSRIRRIEAGILDFGADMDEGTNPFEAALDRLVDLDSEADFIGKAALQRIKAHGVARKAAGIEIEGPPVSANDQAWPAYNDSHLVGEMTSWVYSPRLERNIGFAMLQLSHTAIGTEVTIDADGDQRRARVVETPFVDPDRKLAKG
ncbi:MAG: glycine cleavage T C-terminal barrel domain-containing protein, partial [Kiloniellales bacterium]